MRRWLLPLMALAATLGCGGSRHEVRVDSSLTEGSTQQKLDGVASPFFPNLLGGSP